MAKLSSDQVKEQTTRIAQGLEKSRQAHLDRANFVFKVLPLDKFRPE